MARWHYEGELGIFDYDDREFEYVDDDKEPYLAYVGEETDGSKIKIPEGIRVCNYMFMDSSIETPPVIPKSVRRCVYMFSKCKSLVEAPVIPEGVVNCNEMFGDCSSLKKASKIPGSVKNCQSMFYKCEALTEPPIISEGVEDCTYMFMDCVSLVKPVKIPDSAIYCGHMFFKCKSLEEAPAIPEGVKDCGFMFIGCKSLKKAPPVLPASVSSTSFMFCGCESLERPPIFRCEVRHIDWLFGKCPFVNAISRWRTHEFSEKEQCALLAGETVTFEHTIRGGRQITVRGCFDTYENDGPTFGFVRTDVPKAVRRRLPDLPDESEKQVQNGMSIV